MADELPEPKSRKESYLAKAAGMDVTIPEKPESRLEQYLDAIAEGGGGGGGGSYTAGDGIDITNDTISVDTDTIQEKLTAGTGIDITNNIISATGGGGPTVVQTTGTSTTDVMSQNAATSMIFADAGTDSKIKIGSNATSASNNSIAIGSGAGALGSSSFRSTVVGNNASSQKQDAVALGASSSVSDYGNCGVAIGRSASCNRQGAVALGAYSSVSYAGEVNIGSTNTSYGYNNTNYRLLTGVHDGQDAHDAVTVGQVNTRLGGLTLLTITQTAYDALATKDANTLYVITGA